MRTKQDGRIVIDYFNKILISYSDSENCKGCRNCLLKRFINTRKDRLFVRKKTYKSLPSELFDTVTNTVIADLKKDYQLVDSKNRRKFYIFDKVNFSLEADYFLPVPDCECCGTLKDDSKETMVELGEKLISEIKSEKVIPFRSKNKKELLKVLESTILSKNSGIVTTLMDSTAGPLPLAVALLPVENGNDEPGSGRTSTIENSRAVAMLEAIERYAGFMPRGKRTTIYDSYENLKKKNDVIDIKKIILHEDSISKDTVYTNNIFRFEKKQKYHWIYGYNLTSQKSVLLPETLGYYGMKLKSAEYNKENFVYEISNGCSVGSTLLEAAYFGTLEVIERDAFLSCWYTSRKIKRIVIDSFDFTGGEKLRTDLEKFREYYADFKINFYDITNDVGIPTVLATMQREKINEKKLNFMCAAAADINLVSAIDKSLHELSSVYLGFQEKFESEYNRMEYLTNHLYDVEDMLEHSLVYGYYKNISRIKFQENTIAEYNLNSRIDNNINSLNDAFRRILENLRLLNKELIVIDQTTEEMRDMGIYCVKTIIPGLLPMTFNARNVRVSQERINELQKTQKEKLQVRLIPHPFP